MTFYAREARGRNAGANREFTFQGSVAGISSDLVEEIADGAAVRFVTLKPTYEEAVAAGKRVTHPHDGHLNEPGHQLVAEALYREIKSVVRSAINE